ncbi:class I SAM-dependent methyltransferase [Butyrivibrio fibrisolvens]|uniref:class I SAM-dependent methyltransferase n=1 Tax=Butyrivibrio fibrisolvens TaxID=831 RepID=UPI00041BA612|nr:class I SAM-dependent methyltransferase [Butyrivibrio fibrisolvens]
MEKDTINRNLGLKMHKCRVCGAEGMFQSYIVREMLQGTRDEFEYFVCPKCVCLQIAEVPDNLGDYYGTDYYSMKQYHDFDCDFKNPVVSSDKILDVGCGIGGWLYGMAYEGHDNLFGCDPFIENEIDYGDRVHIYKCEITDVQGDGTFDGVRMGDSFEHVTNPNEVIQKAAKLINEKGNIMLKLPIYPNIAFDLFETHWYQLDAPRHIFLHSLLSLKYLADKCGLEIVKVEYDSNETQIVRSFFYQQNVAYYEQTPELVQEYFSNDEMNRITTMVQEANANHRGDHVKVWLMKADA